MEGGIAHADIKKLSFPNNSVEDLVPVTLHAQGETVFQYGVVGDNPGHVFKRLSTYIAANAMPAVHLACQYRVYAISPCAYIEQGYAGLGASLIRKARLPEYPSQQCRSSVSTGRRSAILLPLDLRTLWRGYRKRLL